MTMKNWLLPTAVVVSLTTLAIAQEARQRPTQPWPDRGKIDIAAPQADYPWAEVPPRRRREGRRPTLKATSTPPRCMAAGYRSSVPSRGPIPPTSSGRSMAADAL